MRTLAAVILIFLSIVEIVLGLKTTLCDVTDQTVILCRNFQKTHPNAFENDLLPNYG